MPRKKEYIPSVMVGQSRYQVLFPTLDREVQEKVLQIMSDKLSENPEYCDAGNYQHLCNIMSAAGIYLALIDAGKSREDAFQIVSTAMWDYVEKTMAPTYRKLFRLPGMLKIMGKLLPKMFQKGSGYGWRYVWHLEEATNSHLRFECHQCIYAPLFAKFGIPELGPMFCHVDDINFGRIKGLQFKREHTLCKDGKPCDFLFERISG